jgi:adenylate cyclase
MMRGVLETATTPPTTPQLIYQTAAGEASLSLTQGNCWTLGRSEDNNFILPERWISRNHAMLQQMDNGEIFLIDLGSRNGTFVNGRRVSIPVTLHHGDQITFGQTELSFNFPMADPAMRHILPDRVDNTATAMLHIRHLVSILVIDIRNFTVLTRQLDEQILSELIGSWFRLSGEIIRTNGSWVDKYIGDAVMAVWIHGEESVEAAGMLSVLRAVAGLQRLTLDLSNRYPVPFPLQIGAGINTGYAMVGNSGSGDRPDYTPLGNTVNMAFRLETATKQIGLDVAVGTKTYEFISQQPGADQTFQPYSVELKGYDEATETYACSFNDLQRFLQSKP